LFQVERSSPFQTVAVVVVLVVVFVVVLVVAVVVVFVVVLVVAVVVVVVVIPQNSIAWMALWPRVFGSSFSLYSTWT
jgi:hypothetical protein